MLPRNVTAKYFFSAKQKIMVRHFKHSFQTTFGLGCFRNETQ
jgi:hypothetical protein